MQADLLTALTLRLRRRTAALKVAVRVRAARRRLARVRAQRTLIDVRTLAGRCDARKARSTVAVVAVQLVLAPLGRLAGVLPGAALVQVLLARCADEAARTCALARLHAAAAVRARLIADGCRHVSWGVGGDWGGKAQIVTDKAGPDGGVNNINAGSRCV